MKLYSDFAPRRARQILVDLVSLALIAVWVWFGLTVYRLISELAAFGRQMEDAGAGFKSTLTDVGETLGGIPLIGDGIRAPFEGASGAGLALEQAGQTQQDTTVNLALVIGLGVSLLPILMILLLWLPPRIRFARRAGHAKALVRAGAGVDLLAFRALNNQKLTTITKIHEDAIGAWRQGDEAVMRKPATLELEASGIRLR